MGKFLTGMFKTGRISAPEFQGSGAALTIIGPPCQGPRGGVGEGLKPFPRGKRGSGKKDSWEGVHLNHLSPKGLVGFGS